MTQSLKFLMLLLLTSAVAFAQNPAKVDSIVKLYPKSYSSTVRLSDKIKTDFNTDYDKARAVFAWIALNINYDVEFYQKLENNPSFVYSGITDKQIDDSVIKQVLLKRKAVCDGYSRLFNRLATEVGLESQIISGIAKIQESDIGVKDLPTNHAWNLVKISGKWCLMDVTWGAGFATESFQKFKKEFMPFYFDTPAKRFFTDHFPEDGKWQDEMLDKQTFVDLPIYHTNRTDELAYELIEPKNGIITTKNNSKISFKIRNLSQDNIVSYTVKAKEESTEVAVKTQNGDALEFEILVDETIKDYITLYIGSLAYATFKVIKN